MSFNAENNMGLQSQILFYKILIWKIENIKVQLVFYEVL